MKVSLSIFATVMLLLTSCTFLESNAQVGGEFLLVKAAVKDVSSKRQSLNGAIGSEQIVLVKFANGISLHWDNRRHTIVADSLYSSIVAVFPKKRTSFIALISDTTDTYAKTCDCSGTLPLRDRNLVAGDVAFLLLDKVKGIPYFHVLGIQFDSFEKDCHYPCGMLEYINNNRNKVRKKVASYFSFW